MAELKVEIFKIDDVQEHPNADRLELAFIGGWQIVIGLGSFKAGDRAIYIPVDSIVPHDVENILFPPGSKIKLNKSRVRSIKIRGAMSQGMLVAPETLGLDPNIKVGTDVAEKLDIKKYYPPAKSMPSVMKAKKKRHKNPAFKVYTDISHFKYYIKAMEGLFVWATEKIHGTNFRAGYVPWNRYNLWNKFLNWIGKPFGKWQYEFAYGSHRVELTRKGKRTTGFYDQNVYYMMSEQYKLREILQPGEVIYAEIYGWNIQKGYFYGCKENEWKMVVVDVMIDGKYLSGKDSYHFCRERGLPYAPIVSSGQMFDYETFNKLANPDEDKSTLYPELERPMEGIVLKPYDETQGYMGRMVFKWINDNYWLAKGNTDWH
jgi:RNA ligase (TIGR02306 family)